jgi:hypothetical protein
MTEKQPEKTPAGHVERRSAKYLTLDDFAWWRRRAVAAFVVLMFVSAGALYWAVQTGHDSTRRARESTVRLRVQAASASLASCYAGKDLRLVIAVAIDDLRRSAIPKGATAATAGVDYDLFLTATQGSIDELLRQAAEKPQPTDPAGPLTLKKQRAVEDLGRRACEKRTLDQYGFIPEMPPRRSPLDPQ